MPKTDTSVIHEPVKEAARILREVLKDIKKYGAPEEPKRRK